MTPMAPKQALMTLQQQRPNEAAVRDRLTICLCLAWGVQPGPPALLSSVFDVSMGHTTAGRVFCVFHTTVPIGYSLQALAMTYELAGFRMRLPRGRLLQGLCELVLLEGRLEVSAL